MLGKVGYHLLAWLWIGHQRTVKRRAEQLDELRVRLAVLHAQMQDAKEREEGLVWQLDKLLGECRNEHRAAVTLDAFAMPMKRLRSLRRK